MDKRLFLGENPTNTNDIDHEKVKHMVELSIATSEASRKVIQCAEKKSSNFNLVAIHSRLVAERSTLYLSATQEEKDLARKMLEELTD